MRWWKVSTKMDLKQFEMWTQNYLTTTCVTIDERARGKNLRDVPPEYIFWFKGLIFGSFHALASIYFFTAA
jgi:hypothetical protein